MRETKRKPIPRNPRTLRILAAIKAGAPSYQAVADMFGVSRVLVTTMAKMYLDSPLKYRNMGVLPAWKCGACGYRWLGRKAGKPSRCPKQDCQALHVLADKRKF